MKIKYFLMIFHSFPCDLVAQCSTLTAQQVERLGKQTKKLSRKRSLLMNFLYEMMLKHHLCLTRENHCMKCFILIFQT